MGFWLWDSSNNIVTEININANGDLHTKQYNVYWNSSGFTYGSGSETPIATIPKSYLRKVAGAKNNIYIVTNDSLLKYDSLTINQDVEANEHWDSPSGTGIYASVRAASFYLNYKKYDNTVVSNGISTAFHRFFSPNLRATFSNLYSSCIDMKNLVIRQADYYFSCWKNNSSEVWLPALYSGGWFNTIPWFMSSPFKYISTDLYQIDVDANATGIALSPIVSAFANRFSCNNVDIRNGQYGGLASIVATEGVPFIVDQDAFETISGAKIVDVADEEVSIYTPGGDSSDPHNPYPSGPSPYTVDPLNSGVETDSPDTDGTWELPFDNVPDSPATVHSVNLGLYNAYALSAMQVMELANYLFSGITEVGENLVKLIWGSKRDVVISLIEFPLMVTNQGSEEIRFIFDTVLAGMFHGKQLINEYLPIDFGTIVVDRYSGTFYDFEPYTTLTLYIPYIGYIDLKPTEVIGSTLSISGYVHLTTGEINVNVKSSRTGILGSYSGTIGRMLPIADADATKIYSAIIKTAASLGAVAVAGVGASSAAATAASIGEPSTKSVEVASANYVNAIEAWGAADDNVRQYSAEMKIASHDYQRAKDSYREAKSKYNQVNKAADNAREDFHDALSEAGSNAIGAVTTGFNVTRGTVITSSNGRLSPQRCFLRIEVPHQNVSRNQKILGYPANSSDSLNSSRLHGYTELRAIELSIPRATFTELQELENILKGGFYLP